MSQCVVLKHSFNGYINELSDLGFKTQESTSRPPWNSQDLQTSTILVDWQIQWPNTSGTLSYPTLIHTTKIPGDIFIAIRIISPTIILFQQPCCLQLIRFENFWLQHALKASCGVQKSNSLKRLTLTLLSQQTFSKKLGLSYLVWSPCGLPPLKTLLVGSDQL